MSYIDAILDKEKNIINVIERNNGKRSIVQYPTEYEVYWPDSKGKFTSIFGDNLLQFRSKNYKDFQKELKILHGRKLFESDINPIFRCLYNNYHGRKSPELHVGFFDIEVDFDKDRGFSSPEDAFSPLTAITIYLNWLEANFTLVLKPKKVSTEEAQEICNKFENTILCKNEKELLTMFLDLIEDVDLLTGWNSTGFDIPYLHNRIVQVLGKEETKRLCLLGKKPTRREYTKFGKEHVTYDLVGRTHIDYLDLYKKHITQEMHSYSLDSVGEFEINERKTPYEGTLDHLYNNDFEKFISYNRQDVMIVVKIDEKRKFLNLANEITHSNTVLFPTTMGAVALIDQAIVNFAWNLKLKVPSRVRVVDDSPVMLDEDGNPISRIAGAHVANPVKGLHDWIGAVDINSLYPSTIRALNMSPETLIGQVRLEYTTPLIIARISDPIDSETASRMLCGPDDYQKMLYDAFISKKVNFAEAWNNVFGTYEFSWIQDRREDVEIHIDFEDSEPLKLTAKEAYDIIYNSNEWMMSGNGTIFRLDKQGIIPGILSEWYSNRKKLQAEEKAYNDLYYGIDIDDDLVQLLS